MNKIKGVTAPFSYADQGTPEGYRCGYCHATGVRLYRLYNVFLDGQRLSCRTCACKDGEEQPYGQDEHIIGWLVAAVPTEEGDTYWGFSSVPQSGVDWWNRLPKRFIPKAELIPGRWYIGIGRHSNVAFYAGIGKPPKRFTFLTISLKMHQPSIYDQGVWEEDGCFQPMELIEEQKYGKYTGNRDQVPGRGPAQPGPGSEVGQDPHRPPGDLRS